ncbi:MAG: hypothetical protein QXP97_00765 [Desulfurococcus sp.]|uniref:hypothetical protein n=1 Tax=Desulfurococcus sp. TaxID=51678 RepID=UPI00316263A9
MNLLNDEVFAVILALIIVASVFTVAQEFRGIEPFNAIGLLNQECKIGYYPDFVLIGENLTLCIYIYNYMGSPEAYMVVYKFGTPDTLPTNTTPSPEPALWNYTVVLNHGEEALLKIGAPIPYRPDMIGDNASLIFELWMYNTAKGEWEYTGRWVHLHVVVREVPLLG